MTAPAARVVKPAGWEGGSAAAAPASPVSSRDGRRVGTTADGGVAGARIMGTGAAMVGEGTRGLGEGASLETNCVAVAMNGGTGSAVAGE